MNCPNRNEQPGDEGGRPGGKLQGRIGLGFPLDQLLNQQVEISPVRDKSSPRAITLPRRPGDPGTGNIIIHGPPGSGKSTLGLQIAVACAARPENSAISAYVSLESTVDEVRAKAEAFGWDRRWYRRDGAKAELESSDLLLEAKHLADVDQFATPATHARDLLAILTRHNECPAVRERTDDGPPCVDCDLSHSDAVQPCVLLPTLSPRAIGCEDDGALFWRRFDQLERLLVAAETLESCRGREDDPLCTPIANALEGIGRILPVVVIDSLSMFGAAPLSRSDVHQLFRLFRRHRRIGVFTVETADTTPFDSTIADVVIRLSATRDRGYFVRHLEIEKSRYIQQVYGAHPFKTVSPKREQMGRAICTPDIPGRDGPEFKRFGCVVYPSLHYIVLKTESRTETSGHGNGSAAQRDPERLCDCFAIDAFKRITPGNLRRGWVPSSPEEAKKPICIQPGSVAMVEGARGTFKTSFALNFLAHGLVQGESAMLVRLSDTALLAATHEDGGLAWPKPSCEIADGFSWDCLQPDVAEPGADATSRLWENLADVGKVLIRKLDFLPGRPAATQAPGDGQHPPRASGANPDVSAGGSASLFELDFKGGALLPEELVHLVREVLIRRNGGTYTNPIRRVVLDDVGQIGVSYPFLRQSLTTHDLFLPAFVHVMRNHGVDLVMVGTTGDLAEADEAVSRARALADAVVLCRHVDVFGKRHVVVSGGGLLAGSAEDEAPSAPSVVRVGANGKCFEVDEHYLEGLVGLDTEHIHRPGLTIHVFQENERIHGAYVREMERMLRAGLGRPDRWAARSVGLGDAGSFGEEGTADVSVEPFSSDLSEAIHDSLDVLAGRRADRTGGGTVKPVDRTVLCTVDEFSREGASDRFLRPAVEHSEGDGRTCDGERDRDKGGGSDGPDAHLRTYYRNVLLLAYRTDWLTSVSEGATWPPPTWAALEEQIMDQAQSVANAPEGHAVRSPFWFDLTARETLSCLLLDALLSARGESGSSSGAAGRKAVLEQMLFADRQYRKDKEFLSDEEIVEVSALSRLMESTHDYALDVAEDLRTAHVERTAALVPGMPKPTAADLVRSGGMDLPPHAGVYACWYSHLRELIDREPWLAGKLKVCPLPGGGFRGDWYIGILKGSVSAALGREVIRKLCRREEEYKRFARGVGLPVHEDFRQVGDFFAWPRGTGVPVERVFEIHEGAWSRSAIAGYTQIRSTLSMVAWQLTGQAGPGLDETTIIQDVGRLFSQIRMLTGRPSLPRVSPAT